MTQRFAGPVYAVPFGPTAVTGAVDLIEAAAAADAGLAFLWAEIMQTTEVAEAEEEVLEILISRVEGSPTSGSGGSAGSEQPLAQWYPAAGFTSEVLNTTQISGGTAVDAYRMGFQVRQGSILYTPPPGLQLSCDASEHLVLSLPSAPADSITLGGVGIFGELQG